MRATLLQSALPQQCVRTPWFSAFIFITWFSVFPRSWAACCMWPSFEQGLGLERSQRSLPPQPSSDAVIAAARLTTCVLWQSHRKSRQGSIFLPNRPFHWKPCHLNRKKKPNKPLKIVQFFPSLYDTRLKSQACMRNHTLKKSLAVRRQTRFSLKGIIMLWYNHEGQLREVECPVLDTMSGRDIKKLLT